MVFGFHWQVLRLLCAIHRQGMRHRDIKPDNLMLYDDKVMLIDWLFAVDGGGDVFAPYCGAVHYVSPALAKALDDAREDAGFWYTFTKLDDLESWLRVCIALSNRWVEQELYKLAAKGTSAVAIARFWERVIDHHKRWRVVREKIVALASVDDSAADYSDLEDMLPLPYATGWSE